MTDTLARPGYDWLGFPIATATGPVCGRCKDHHLNIQAIKDCYETAAQRDADATDSYDAEMAYERHLENRGYEDARAQDAYEASHGVVGFTEAWHAQSPDTCPCPDH